MIIVNKAVNADSRSANSEFNKKSLLNDTKSHITDVTKGMNFMGSLISNRGSIHDHTKIEYIYDFYNALNSGKIKESEWYQKHITEERHHLKSNAPEDVNLIDVIEHLVDCTIAGMTRSGTIYDVDLSPELLEKAVANTVELLKNNIKVIE